MRYCSKCGSLMGPNTTCNKCGNKIIVKKKFKTGPFYKTLKKLKEFPTYKKQKVTDFGEISFLEPESVGDIERNLVFATNYNDINKLNFCPIRISLELKQEFQYKDHTIDGDGNEDYANQYTKFCNATGLRGIANYIKKSCSNMNDDEEVINAILSFVQHKNIPASLHYIWEKGKFEFPKFPIETLFDGGGDCEDLSILFTSLIKILGYETVLILAYGWKSSDDHMYAGIHLDKPPSHFENFNYHYREHNGKKYYTCECTMIGFMLGDDPEDDNYQYREIVYVNL